MRCPACQSTAVRHRTAQGYRRFRCGDCGKQFNERSAGLLNRAQYPSDVIALVVLWRLRYKLSLRDLAEMLLIRGLVFSYEAVRDWEAKLTPARRCRARRPRLNDIRICRRLSTPPLQPADAGQPAILRRRAVRTCRATVVPPA